MRIFDVLDKPLTDYDKSFAVYLDLYDEEYEDVAPEIYRIVWTKGNDVDAVDLSRFAIYCCYPYVYREPNEDAHPGYECFGVEELEL